MKAFLQALKRSFLHLVYPTHCVHCRCLIQEAVFCSGCSQLLELIDPEERCTLCFNLTENLQKEGCDSCRQQKSPFYRQASAFDYMGPAASLIKQLKYANQPYLARGAGAFLAMQLEQLQWPLPDAIVPVPLSWTHWLMRGYNQSELLAESLGQLLSVPVWHVLKRESGDYSQAGLNLTQRQKLTGKHFKRQPTVSIQDKTLLVIDDVHTTGSTLKRCGESLLDGLPGSLYALTFCRTLD